MSLEGLEYILAKKEVVPTVSARDLLERTEQVDADYKRHVRTYVPISRATERTENQLSVEEFERRAIKQVKDGKAPRGYLTAEYGYGKTSTALYLWNRAEEANLIVVPPFQMLKLPDLVVATHGWVRYRLSTSRPALLEELDALYTDTTQRSIEQEADRSGADIAQLKQWVQEGRFILELQTADYLGYFDKVTALIEKAGFDGLIILPDEIQQYIEPQMHSREGDPIAPFFNLVQGLATRENHLRMGFIMVIPLKEIGVIREARGRGDFLDRMKSLSIDLSAVYDQDFAKRLWKKLSQEFEFEDIASAIVRPETLDALGEIASRDDISNGPRTVINTFRRMVDRYIAVGHASSQPYTPIDMVDDLLSGNIQFSGNNQIQNVVRRALQSGTVKQDIEYFEPAIKLAAAFPNDGIPINVQRLYSVDKPLEDLMRIALGDLVIPVGPIEKGGITLSGLDRVQIQREWLPQTIRDFRRGYSETHNDTRDRALEVFEVLLKERVFKNWKIIKENPGSLTSNRSIIFEGDFQSFATRFPKRRIQVRIFWEDEERKDAFIDGDAVIEYYLSIHRDEENRNRIASPIQLVTENSEYGAIVPVNLMYIRPEGVPKHIQQQLQGVWSPYELTPLVLMNIYQMLEDKRQDNLIPRQDDQYIKAGFQPELLDSIARDIFNADIGSPVGAAGEDITKLVIEQLLEGRYGSIYKTLMAVGNWKSSLQKYIGALDRLDNIYERRGEIEVEGTKEQIARLMTLSNTGLDSFINNFPTLLDRRREWPSQKQIEEGESGAVKFRLHPQEQKIIGWLRESEKNEVAEISGKRQEVHILPINNIHTWSSEMGYQGEEVDMLIDILEMRGLIEIYQKHLIRELPSISPDIEGVATHINELISDIETLMKGFSNSNILVEKQTLVERWDNEIQEQLQSGTPNPQTIYKLSKNVRRIQSELREFARDKQKETYRQAHTIIQSIRPLSQQHLESLERPIEGSVSYVDQVNVLRTALLKHAQKVRGNVEQLRTQLEQVVKALSNENLTYEYIVQQARHLANYENRPSDVSKELAEFQVLYQALNEWKQIVLEGSILLANLQQMEQTTQTQSAEFEQLSRDMRGDISSHTNKLDVLKNHSIYSSRLSDIKTQVRKIREDAEGTFIQRQNSYRQLLISSGLYPREQLGQPLHYNFSNPAESNRLLENEMQKLVLSIIEKMLEITTGHRQEIINILSTPLLKEQSVTVRDEVQAKGESLQNEADGILNGLKEMTREVQDIRTVRDFTPPDAGKFAEIINELISGRDAIAELHHQVEDISQWLRKFQLTPQEEELLILLNVNNLEQLKDLGEWRSAGNLSEEEFWKTLRGLYNKRRIRLLAGQVRT